VNYQSKAFAKPKLTKRQRKGNPHERRTERLFRDRENTRKPSRNSPIAWAALAAGLLMRAKR
jgi:hypothetical protein